MVPTDNTTHHHPLFQTKSFKGRLAYQFYAITVFLAIFLISFYRFYHFPATGIRWPWMLMSVSELWFGFYWFLSQFVRWNPIYRSTFKDRLPPDSTLPVVDVFVCTADPTIEPPIMVVNTVLSVLAYDYPPEKLNVYLSDDDAGSELMFYALFESSEFAKHWLPFCKKFQVEPRSPKAYFSNVQHSNDLFHDPNLSHDLMIIKKLYKDMEDRIETATRVGQVTEETRKLHKGFREWNPNSNTTSSDHQAIIQILIDGRSSMSLDVEGEMLPMLVYAAREKRSQYSHCFKAGALNALIRVSSVMSNGPIILNVDCDVYSNNSKSVRDALCCFMDEEKGNEIAYVQFPQSCYNLTNHDMYASCFRVPNELEMGGMDANGGPCYIGSGCFHRRIALCGAKYDKNLKLEWKTENIRIERESISILEERCKALASCTYEENTEWGTEIGLKYGFPTEDFVTGLAIQCRGWKSLYLNPKKKGFVGIAPTTLLHVLVQHTRWSEGQFSILLSKCCPFVYGYKRIPFALQMSYTLYLLWAPNCLPTLFYVTIPPLCLLKHISLFPNVSSFWVLPFLYVIISQYIYSLGEFVSCGGTFKGWLNEQRMWLFKRTTSYFIACVETFLGQFGFSELGFTVTPKVVDEDTLQRYKNEIMEFGSHSEMFTVLSSIALLNLLCLFWSFKTMAMDSQKWLMENLGLQIGLCIVVVWINFPVYEGLFLQKDKGKMPTSVTRNSLMLVFLAFALASYC